MSSSDGDLPCADPSNASFGSVAEAHSPAGYEPKDLKESKSVLVKPMFLHRPSMTSIYDSVEIIATISPESDVDDDQIRNMLAPPLYLQEREASADRPRVDHSFRENSVTSSAHFRERAGKPAAMFSHKGNPSQETLSDREGETFFRFSDPEEAASLEVKKETERPFQRRDLQEDQ